jgi:hypothetical protein
MTPSGRCAFVEAIQGDGRVALTYVERHQIRHGTPTIGPHADGVVLPTHLLQRISSITGEPIENKR